MSVGVAIGVGLLLGVVVLAAAFEVCDRCEKNLFHIGDA